LLVGDNAGGLILLFQLKVRFKLVDVGLEHFDKELQWIADLIRESHRRVERTDVEGQLPLGAVVLLGELGLDERLVELLSDLDALVLDSFIPELLVLMLL
jgi:hypothetical protein